MKGAPVGLANAERPPGDTPSRSTDDRLDPRRGYWLGGAVAEVDHWRRRALEAEAELRRRAQLGRSR